MVWGTVMSQALGVLKNERISGGALIIMAACLYAMYAWADGAHANMAASHAELVKQEEFNQLKKDVEHGFEQMELNDASQQIRDIKLSLQVAQATSAPDTEIRRIEDALDHAKSYKSCLVRREPNCEHLREVE